MTAMGPHTAEQMLDSHVYRTHGRTFYEGSYHAWKQGGPDPFCMPVPEPQPQPARAVGGGARAGGARAGGARAGGADPLMQRLGRAAGAAGGRQRANTDPGGFGRGQAGGRTTSGASAGEDGNNPPTGRPGKVDNLERAKSLGPAAAAAAEAAAEEEGDAAHVTSDLFGDAVE